MGRKPSFWEARDSVLGRASLRFLLLHPWQLALSMFGIALGVAVVTSVDLAKASAKRAFDLSIQAVLGKATHRIVGGPSGLADSLYLRLRVGEGLRLIAPILQGYVTLPERRGETLQLLGIDPFAEPPFHNDWLASTTRMEADISTFIAEPATALVSESTGRRLGVERGDRLTIRIGAAEHTLRVLGWLNPATESERQALDNLLLTDIATAQELLGMSGRISHINLIVPDSLEADATLKRIQQLLPGDAALIPASAHSQAIDQMTRAFYTNLRALSLLALLVGAFLIYNTMSFLVLQRRQLIGTLRALGVTRGQTFGLILIEAIGLGGLGTVAGLLLGIGLGQALVGLVTQTINDLYFTVSVRELALTPPTFVRSALLGVMVTLLASLVPALEAASVPARVALERASLEARIGRLVPWTALAGLMGMLLGSGVIAMSSKSLVLGFIGFFALMVGCALLTPLMTVMLVWVLQSILARGFGILGQLSARTVTAALSRTAVAIAALMLAVASTVGIGVMIASFRLAVTDWLETLLHADLYISVPGLFSAQPASLLDRGFSQRLVQAPGVAAISTSRWFKIEMSTAVIDVVAYQLAPASYHRFRFKEGEPDQVWPAFESQDAVLVSEPYAYHRGLHVGSTLRLRTKQGERDFKVAGVYYDYSSDRGVVAISRRTFERYWDGEGFTSIGVYGQPGVGLETLRRTVQSLADPHHTIMISSNRAIRDQSLKIFDRSFAITEVLRLLAAVIACVGIVSALMALQLERTRELGVLRACGVTPRQLGVLVISETGLMGLIAGVLALPVGVLVATILLWVINQRSFGWAIELQVEPGILVQGLMLALISAVLAGIYPAVRVARLSPVEALRAE